MPKKVVVAEIEDGGGVLAEPVINKFGQVLFPAGLALEQKHVRILKTWNITEVLVQDQEASDDTPVITLSIRGLAEERLSHRLTWTPRNFNEQDFISMGVDHIAEQIINSSRR